MNIKTFLFLAAAAVCIFFFTGCRPAPKTTGAVTVDSSSSGGEVTVPLDQILIVQLQSNPTTGYSWGVLECDLAVLQPLGDPEYVASQPGKQIAGSGGHEIFRFQPQSTGETTLKLGYRRPWETDVEPVEFFEINVTVE